MLGDKKESVRTTCRNRKEEKEVGERKSGRGCAVFQGPVVREQNAYNAVQSEYMKRLNCIWATHYA